MSFSALHTCSASFNLFGACSSLVTCRRQEERSKSCSTLSYTQDEDSTAHTRSAKEQLREQFRKAHSKHENGSKHNHRTRHQGSKDDANAHTKHRSRLQSVPGHSKSHRESDEGHGRDNVGKMKSSFSKVLDWL